MSETLQTAIIERCYYTECPYCSHKTHYYFQSTKGMPESIIICKTCRKPYKLKE